jgi:hypothetical protein
VTTSIGLQGGLSLQIGARPAADSAYPTRQLQRGLLLSVDGRGLAEEGVGFGVPVLKRGLQTVFPGGLEVEHRRADPPSEVKAVFRLDLVESLARPGRRSLDSRTMYAAKDALAALHRRAPRLRGALTATSSSLRKAFGWETVYEAAGSADRITVTYAIDAESGRVDVGVDLPDLSGHGVTEIVVMNEQGARYFDEYRDTDGTVLRGDEIGTWDDVVALGAGFVSTTDGVSFWLDQVPGACLSRGRELVGTRLAWAGFGYSLPPTVRRFAYSLRIARTL